MSVTGTTSNIRIEPVNVLFGRYQEVTVTCAADIAGSHAGDYFAIYTALDAVRYNIWYKVSGTGSAPVATGTEVEVDIATGDTAATIATATATAIAALTGFAASASGGVVTVTNTQPGLSTIPATIAGLVGFTYAITLAGDSNDLGFCDGDIELKLDEKLLDITAHQTGSDVLTSLRQGKTAEISMTLKETDIDNLKLILKQAGALYTPSGGTEVAAWGTSTNSLNVIQKAGKLVLHPTANSVSDYTRDWAFWKAHFKPESVTFSGENPMQAKVTFKCYTDVNKTEEANLFVVGDHTQDFDNT